MIDEILRHPTLAADLLEDAIDCVMLAHDCIQKHNLLRQDTKDAQIYLAAALGDLKDLRNHYRG